MNDFVNIPYVKQSLRKFFGREMKVIPLPKIVTKENIKKWKQLRLSLHYLPKELATQDQYYPGWKKMIQEDWFYNDIERGALSQHTLELPGKWVLIDDRPKPVFRNGRQQYNGDEKFLKPIITKLREEKKIDPEQRCLNVPLGSRFGIAPSEYDRFIRPELAKLLGVKKEQIRLPRAIEWSYLGNCHYRNWGKTNTWEWFCDKKDKGLRRTYGGCIDDGGISGVYWNSYYVQFNCIGLRPLVVLS